MRRIIAERMKAGSSVPTFTAEIEVDMTGCIQLRSELNEHSKGTRFGYHDIIAKCAAIAVENYPLVNASFTDQGSIPVSQHRYCGLVRARLGGACRLRRAEDGHYLSREGERRQYRAGPHREI